MINQILTNLIQVGQALEIGEIDHDKTWHIERAKEEIYKEFKGLAVEVVDAESPLLDTKYFQAIPLSKLRKYLDIEESDE